MALNTAVLRVSSLFIELRELHRSLCTYTSSYVCPGCQHNLFSGADVDAAKGETAKAKAEFERIALLLQNLKYADVVSR